MTEDDRIELENLRDYGKSTGLSELARAALEEIDRLEAIVRDRYIGGSPKPATLPMEYRAVQTGVCQDGPCGD